MGGRGGGGLVGGGGGERRDRVGEVGGRRVVEDLLDDCEAGTRLRAVHRVRGRRSEVVVHVEGGDRGTVTQLVDDRLTPDLRLGDVVQDVADRPREVGRVTPEREAGRVEDLRDAGLDRKSVV